MNMSAVTIAGMLGCGAAAGIGIWEGWLRPLLGRRRDRRLTYAELVAQARECLAWVDYRPGMSEKMVFAIYGARAAVYKLAQLIDEKTETRNSKLETGAGGGAA
jgi:hypothetical protein